MRVDPARTAGALAAALAMGVIGVMALRADREALRVPETSGDAAEALVVLDAVRDVSPLACELIVSMLSSKWWGGLERQPDAPRNYLPLLHWIMQRSADSARVAPLRRGLADPDPCVRRLAPRLLARSDHPQALAALLEALHDPAPAARRAAAVGLGYASRPETVGAVRDALSDPHPEVRAAVTWALARLEAAAPKDSTPILQVAQDQAHQAASRRAQWANLPDPWEGDSP